MPDSGAYDPSPFCTNCGYPRTGLPRSHPCPECGRSASPARRRICTALAPVAVDVRDTLLFGLATAGLGFLLAPGLRHGGRNAPARRICRLTICRQPWGHLFRPRTLLLGWVGGILLAIVMMVLQGLAQHFAQTLDAEAGANQTLRLILIELDPVLAAFVLVFLSLPVLQTVAAMGAWHGLALAAVRLPATSARSSATIVGACLLTLLGAIICFAVWPQSMARFDDRWLLVVFVPLLLAAGRWLWQWHGLVLLLQREARVRALPA